MDVLLNLICLSVGLLLGGYAVYRWSQLALTCEQLERLKRDTARTKLAAATERRRGAALEHINLNSLGPHDVDIDHLEDL